MQVRGRENLLGVQTFLSGIVAFSNLLIIQQVKNKENHNRE